MEERYNDREFEQFIKNNADQYRMFPSEKVWNSIHNTLHTKRRWYGIGLIFLLLSTGVVTWLMLPTTAKKQSTENNTAVISKTLSENKINSEDLIIPAKKTVDASNEETVSTKLQPTIFFSTTHNLPVNSNPSSANIVANTDETTSNILPTPVIPIVLKRNEYPSALIIKSRLLGNKQIVGIDPKEIVSRLNTSIDKNYQTPANIETEGKNNTDVYKNDEQKDIYPLTIESVVNVYKSPNKRKKLSWQFYLAPTISYRALKENMNYVRAARSNGTIPTNVYISYQDINNVVKHKPDVGFELGVNTAYPVTKNFSLTGGLQFNISKYDILAFNNYQREVATIALNSTGSGNSVSAVTSYRSYGNENRSGWIHNLYISASMPIGVEIKFNSIKKSYIGISSTLQPTYVLANRAYLISTDFKNYAEVPSLTRKWNLNTAMEIFAGYSTPKLDWKVGPQVRYQTLSSFQDKYPVREHLFDFGLKIGVTLK